MWHWLVVPLLAFAGSGAEPDPQEGPQFRLDVASASAARHSKLGFDEIETIELTIRTYAPFTNADLQQADGEDYAVAIGISTDDDEAFERVCYVHVGEGLSPYAVVTKGKQRTEADSSLYSPREGFAGLGVVDRPSKDSVRVTIPVRFVARGGLERFRWSARMVSSPGSGSVYYDYVPDEGLAEE